MDVAAWLEGLGLRQYVRAFAENGVDADVLPRLTVEDLREIGVVAVGHRRKLVDAIAALQARAAASARRHASTPAASVPASNGNMASTPSPISFSTSPPCAATASMTQS